MVVATSRRLIVYIVQNQNDMKKFFALLLTMFFLTAANAQDTTLIKKIIENETLAFANADLTTWSSYFVHQPYVRWSVSPTMYFDGWDALYNGAKNFLANSSGRNDANNLHKINRSDWNIHINGNVACVKFVQVTEDSPNASQQFRALERGADGQWKIFMLAAVQ
jgi:hypothetical protein